MTTKLDVAVQTLKGLIRRYVQTKNSIAMAAEKSARIEVEIKHLKERLNVSESEQAKLIEVLKSIGEFRDEVAGSVHRLLVEEYDSTAGYGSFDRLDSSKKDYLYNEFRKVNEISY